MREEGETGSRIVRLESAMAVDLATVRDTLAYLQSDMRGVRGCEKVAEALARAIREIDVVAPRPQERPAETRVPGAAWWPVWR